MRTVPSLRSEELDPRSEPYRDRAGRVTLRNGRHVADVYLKTEVYWRRSYVEGQRTWIPNETLHGYIEYADGRFDDFVTPVSMLADELERWDQGSWTIDGEPMHVHWLSSEETAAFRSERGYEAPPTDWTDPSGALMSMVGRLHRGATARSSRRLQPDGSWTTGRSWGWSVAGAMLLR